MAEQQADTFAYYTIWKGAPGWSALAEADRQRAVEAAEPLLGLEHEPAPGGVSVRGVYSTAGFRTDADLMMWWTGPSAEALQEAFVRFRRSQLGRHLELTWAFLGLHRPAEFNPEHIPAFVQGEPPRRFLCIYPFVRTPEWYLLAPAERAALLREHGELARPYPDVRANTVMAFGLGDWEWILAFETDHLPRLVEMIRALRAAGARRYVKVETPFVTGVRKSLRDAVADMG
ncbi:hydrogen peroxide-dependent heme synthase [Carboxydochorda subterranea]|uniref:Coproheme decarboxylase n=1 Tax=Carboxydichorda subterranea TaxID=3109565 RepID=A0ABZ1C1I1_9FIRM|nr:hydrogen peroxide-dependent heme synthase [Limnochorda sp. L945t]WRP18971.1 hydrogen peroxide-dependent heme synthase [Limnochorda sp. L945t]